MKIAKKLLILAVTIVMLCVISVVAAADTYGNLSYSISGSRAIITDCYEYATSVEIPATINGYPVTTISNYSFAGCTRLTGIVIPENVTTIENYAFADCSSLENVVIPNSVTTIGTGAFYGCTSLESVTVPGGVTTIGTEAFAGCTGLTDVVISEGVTTINESAFDSCTSLENVSLPNSLTTIGNFAFYSCSSLESISLPLTVTSIGSSAFFDCNSDFTIYGIANSTAKTYANNNGIDFVAVTPRYTVRYNSNGGTGSMSNAAHTYGTEKTLTTNRFTRSGYRFLGWSTSPTATSPTYTDGESVLNLTSVNNGTVTLYAVWKMNNPVLTVNSSNNATISYSGEVKEYDFIPTKSGSYLIYSSASYDTYVSLYNAETGALITSNDDGGNNRNFRLSQYLDAGTKYTYKIRYYSSSNTGTIPFYFYGPSTISYDANGGTGAPSSQTKSYGSSTYLSSTIPTRTGYTFLGWSISPTATTASYSAGSYFSSNEDVVLYAVWQSRYLAANSSFGARISSSGSTAYFEFTPTVSDTYVIYSTGSYDTYVTLYDANNNVIASNDDGGGSSCNFRLECYLTAGRTYTYGIKYHSSSYTGTITCYFGDTYEVSYDANGGTGAPSYQNKDYGKTLYISSTTPTRTGYAFLGWSTSPNATSPTYFSGDTFTGTSSVTLYAIWQSYYLEVNSSNSTTITSSGYTKTFYFTPEVSGNYVIYSTCSDDTKVYLYDSTGSQLAVNDDGGAGNNFRLQYYLVSGVTYRYNIGYYSSSRTGTIPFKFGRVYTITYVDSASANPVHYSFDYGTEVTLRSDVATRTGYSFLGWSTNRNATTATYQPGANYTENADITLFAISKAHRYSVKYNANGGTGSMANSSHTFGVSKALSANKFKRTGYTFLGWSKSKNDTAATYENGQTVSGLTGVDGRVVNLYAIWKPIRYSIKYSANGGTGSMASSSHTYDVAKTLSANNFTKPGYTFIGWATSRTATTPTYTDKQVVKNLASVNGRTPALYAVWKANTYTVRYHVNGGTGTMANSIHTYAVEKALSSNRFTRTGYKFLGWSTSRTATTPTYTNKQVVKNLTKTTGTVTLYAVWQPKTYTVRYSANGGTGSMNNSSHTYDVSKALPANRFTRTGYKFLGWSTSKTATAATYTNKQSVKNLTPYTGTMTLYAVWQPKTYTVRYSANGGTGSMSNSSHTYDVSKVLPANRFTRTGYTFLGWSTSKTATAATYTNKQSVKNLTTYTGTMTLYAVWKPNTYNIRFNANGGAGTMADATHTYAKEKALSTNKFTRSGYTFLGWATNKSATTATYANKQVVKNLTHTNGKTVTLYAVWKANKYTVKYNANGGTGSMSATSCTYGISKALSENNFTRTGYTFLGWSTNKAATRATFTDMQYIKNLTGKNNGVVTLYAVWKPNTYTVKYNANGGTGTIANSVHTYGTVKNLTGNAFTRSGYTFLGWSTSKTATTPSYANRQAVKNLTSTNNRVVNLYAVWKKN